MRQFVVNDRCNSGLCMGGARGGVYAHRVMRSGLHRIDGNLSNYASADISFDPVGFRIDSQYSNINNYGCS